MTDNTYWQFQQSMVDNPIMLPQQSQPSSQSAQPSLSQPAPPQQQQQAWSDDSDKRKWNHGFSDFDMNTHANKMFHMDDYSNHEPSEGDSPDSTGGSSSKRNDFNDSSMFQGGDQKQRRKEQNRAAQRAFRERKERYVKELQVKIKEMEKKHEDELSRVNKENESLKAIVKKMEAEIYTLKGAAMAFDVSIHKLREAGLDVQQHHPQPHHSIIRDQPSPPRSSSGDRQLPGKYKEARDYLSRNASSAMATIRDKEGYSSTERRQPIRDSLFDSVGRFNPASNNTQSSVVFPDHPMSTDEEMDHKEEEESFAERETNRFEHKPDPIMNSGVKLIPCSQIWERLSQHPNFDEFDMDRLCEELKKKAKCSGTGPVIPESELLDVLRRMDVGMA